MLRESMTRLNTIPNYIDILIFYFCVVRIVDEFYGEKGGEGEKRVLSIYLIRRSYVYIE